MNICVKPHNLRGSIEHYYHFLYGYLLPFIQYHDINSHDMYFFNDCGPVLNKIILDLPTTHSSIIDRDTKIDSSVEYLGFDNGAYKNIDIDKIKNIISNIYHTNIVQNNHDNNNVLLIDRDTPHQFYSTEAKIKGSGSSRRHIPNINEIYEYLSSKNIIVKKIFLEHLSLLDQIKLFNSYRTIIAQHGASMSNLIWCGPQTKIIEIKTRNNPRCFNKLINLCQLRHSIIIQEHRFANIDPQTIYKAILI